MWFELLVLLAGLAYGYMHPGKEDRMALLKEGIIIGIILGIAFGLIEFFAGRGGLTLFVGGLIGIFISVIILVIIFIVGTFVGDFLETTFKK
jgi:hypothetical protein